MWDNVESSPASFTDKCSGGKRPKYCKCLKVQTTTYVHLSAFILQDINVHINPLIIELVEGFKTHSIRISYAKLKLLLAVGTGKNV